MKLQPSKPLSALFICLWAVTLTVAQQATTRFSEAGINIKKVVDAPRGEVSSTTHAAAISGASFSRLAQSGFNHFYNLDYDGAIRDFEADLRAHPDDPFVLNHLLTARLFRELYRIGVLDTTYYTNASFLGQPHRKPDPQEQQKIQSLIRTTLNLENKRLQHSSEDVDMLYERGVTQSLRATDAALVERSWFAAMRSALRARRDHERVLRLDPGYTDAKMVVGIRNYVVGATR